MAHRHLARLLRLLADMSCNVIAWCLSGVGGIGVSDLLLGVRLIAAQMTTKWPRLAQTSVGRRT